MQKRIRIVSVGIVLVILLIGIIVMNNNSNNKYSFTQDGIKYALTLDGEKTTSFPPKGMYKALVTCVGADGRWLYDDWKLAIENITSDDVTCDINFSTITKTNLNDYIISLAGTTQGTGQVVNENSQIVKSSPDGNKLILSEYENYVNDENYPFVWDSTNLTWKSDINSDGAVLNFELSEGEYKICYKSNIDNYEGDISIGDFYADSFTTSFQCEIATNAYDSGGSYIYVSNNNVDNGYIEFYLQKVTPNYEQFNAGIRYEGKNPNNYIWFNNEYWRIIGVFDLSLIHI